MKAKKTLALLLVLPVLGGCSKSSKVEEPSFKAYSNEVTHEVFLEKYSEARDGSDFLAKMATNTPVAGEVKINTASEGDFSYKGENKGSYHSESQKDEAYKFDTVHFRYEKDSKQTTSKEYEFKKSGKSTYSNESSDKRYTGFQEVDEVNVCVVKNYTTGEDAHTTSSPVSAVKSTMISVEKYSIASLLPSVDELEMYKDLPESQKSEYKFFVDGDVFTVVQEYKHEEVVRAIDSATVIGSAEHSFKLIRQAKLGETEFFYATYNVDEFEAEFSRRGTYLDAGIYFDTEEGDKASKKSARSESYSIAFNEELEVAPVSVPTAA
jgi:hypothetical protein